MKTTTLSCSGAAANHSKPALWVVGLVLLCLIFGVFTQPVHSSSELTEEDKEIIELIDFLEMLDMLEEEIDFVEDKEILEEQIKEDGKKE